MMDGLLSYQEEASRFFQAKRRFGFATCAKCKKTFQTEIYRDDSAFYKKRFGALTNCPYCDILFLPESDFIVKPLTPIKDNVFKRMWRTFK